MDVTSAQRDADDSSRAWKPFGFSFTGKRALIPLLSPWQIQADYLQKRNIFLQNRHTWACPVVDSGDERTRIGSDTPKWFQTKSNLHSTTSGIDITTLLKRHWQPM